MTMINRIARNIQVIGLNLPKYQISTGIRIAHKASVSKKRSVITLKIPTCQEDLAYLKRHDEIDKCGLQIHHHKSREAYPMLHEHKIEPHHLAEMNQYESC